MNRKSEQIFVLHMLKINNFLYTVFTILVRTTWFSDLAYKSKYSSLFLIQFCDFKRSERFQLSKQLHFIHIFVFFFKEKWQNLYQLIYLLHCICLFILKIVLLLVNGRMKIVRSILSLSHSFECSRFRKKHCRMAYRSLGIIWI